MCIPQLLLLMVVILMLPDAARPQPFSPTQALPTSLGPVTPEVATAAPPDWSEAPTPGTPSMPENVTTDPFPALPICVCDLTPGTCDLNCCCDKDCDLLHPRTVFSFCLPGSVRSSSWVCVDNSLIFRSNSPFPSRVFTDSSGITQFCVRVNNSKLNYFQKLQTVNATNFEALAAEFGGQYFTLTSKAQPPLAFYRVSLEKGVGESGFPDGAVGSVTLQYPSYSEINHSQLLGDSKQATKLTFVSASFSWAVQSNLAVSKFVLYFIQAGDPILTYYPRWSVVSLLRQPAAVGAGGFCAESNPAAFLERKSTTCTRFFRDLASSCTSEPALDAATYHNFRVLKVPRGMTDLQNTQLQVPVTLTSQTSPPLLAGNTCQNIVSQVIYEIETNGTFGIQKVSVSFRQTSLTVRPGASLQQDFIIHFRAFEQPMAAFPTPRSGNPGYLIGKPLLALTDDFGHSMTLLQSNGNGLCSDKRHEIQFGVNTVSGCKLRPTEVNCSHLQREIYQALHGRPRPEYVAIFGNADPAQKGGWTRILSRNCSVSAVNCTSCCFIPVSLEIQVLWAHIGLQSNPQAHVAGARFLYQCKSVQEHQRGIEVSLTTLVNFVDITQKPVPPRDQPRTDWKLPFDFFYPFKVAFSRGANVQNSAPPVLILCIFLLGVLNSETK
ncbi:tectonic-3 [Peromyscus eremicus]|uniref:tectonic-3 n=1 Tax=Peromyscus eremicus TaxID=42410 RepID=UPI0027DD9097|nr:tectonic-3 [Peromyscus eremicus]